MKVLIILFFTLFEISQNPQNHRVKGYSKKDGTTVQPHRRTNQNKTERDNYTSKPNVNPYTGKKGYKTPKR